MPAGNNKSKSSGLRMLWIPGGRKSHPKGRYDSTNKKISYTTGQKKSEVWSLGGSRTQTNILNADPDTALIDSPSVSGLTPANCAVGAVVVTAAATKCTDPTAEFVEKKPPPDDTSNTFFNNNTPLTPDSTTSTAPLLSPPNSPVSQPPAPIDDEIDTMPTKSKTTPAIVTTTTTAEIIDENRFSILEKDISNEVDIYAFPSPPKDDLNSRNNLLLNTSASTTANSATTATSSPVTSPKSDSKSEFGSSSSAKKQTQNRNHNNNQGDVNSIESISDNTKIANLDMEWIDDLMLEHNGNEMLHKSKQKKKKKRTKAKELDQLDGVPIKSNNSETSANEDEKVVKCLYYTLMCCDCTIS